MRRKEASFMGPLIKITTEPIQMVRFTQNARLVSSDSVDIERRKALARHIAAQRSNPQTQSTVSVEELTRINRAFSRNHTTPQPVQTESFQQMASRQIMQPSVPVSSKRTASVVANTGSVQNSSTSTASIAAASAPAVVQDISVETNTSYTAQRGAFEMRVARGDLTYLPPLVMTIVTQRPQVHVEYLGGFNYVPPLDSSPGGNINLFT